MSLPLYELPAHTTNDEVDDEILEIFAEEMQEVQEEIGVNYAQWKSNPNNKDAAGNLRRAFHTLKGSGRLVGAMLIGELGWAMENLFNRLVEGAIPYSSAAEDLVNRANQAIPRLIEQFQQGENMVNPAVHVLISQAHHFVASKGKELGEFVMPSAALGETAAKEVSLAQSSLDSAALPATEDGEDAEEAFTLPSILSEEDGQDGEETFSLPSILSEEEENELILPELTLDGTENAFTDVPALTDEEAMLDVDSGAFANDIPFVMDASASAPEAAELPELALPSLPEASPLPTPPPPAAVTPPPEPPPKKVAAPVDEDAVDPELMAIYHKEASSHLLALKNFLIACKKNPPCAMTREIFRILHTLNGSSRNVRLNNIASLAAPMETYAQGCLEHHIPLRKDVLALLAESGKMIHKILEGQEADIDLGIYSKLVGAWKRLAAEIPEPLPPHEEASALEQEEYLPVATRPKQPVKKTHAHDARQTAVEAVELEELVISVDTPEPEPLPEPKILYETPPDAVDEFMDIFLEEADEILEKSQNLVAAWLSVPDDIPLIKELQRELHTLKGGARMVGISSMGDLSHQLESVLTRIAEGNAHTNPHLQLIVQESLDELATMLESVRKREALKVPTELIARIANSLGTDTLPSKATGSGAPMAKIPRPTSPQAEPEIRKAKPTLAAPTKPIKTEQPAPTSSERAQKQSLPPTATATPPTTKKSQDAPSALQEDNDERVRVRAALIDKLTNLAGELSILRAHMEQQQGKIKGNLTEMDQTVLRLRDLLRRLEIETEVQIISTYRQPTGADKGAVHGEEFDPLEMDQFSTMQQLSRSLMETVTDLQNIQENLKNLTRQSDSLLVQQNRIGTELQEGIMRTRMIPFSQISPRLQRIARLTAKELHKQVDFTINDDSIEFERTVLNRIVAPLEHMLRNAIGHGVEEPEMRSKAGKALTAIIKIELLREGAELVIKLSDDGAGLNLPAIRKKAEEKGLIKYNQEVPDSDLAQFILEPAFSTAKTITQVSGRGVGMDIANSEIKQLGGMLKIHSITGKGTIFEIRLPMSMTISQALLVHVGEETLAIPLHNVDAVMRMPWQDVHIQSNLEEKYFTYMHQQYRISHLGEMLGFGRAGGDLPLLPLLLVRSGEHRMALVVDGIEGSKEVVVKSIGPQLSGIKWIAGATILGDGRVVIILDVLTLMRANIYVQPVVVDTVTPTVPVKTATIMVVDDSITVRKVTARLLARQGMEVMTAKDGMDAVAQLQERVPDLMLLDVEMPRMDGFELATQIRNTDTLKHLPIIMITSRTGIKHRERAAKIGISRHLGKPFNEAELLENINQLLAERMSP